MEGPYGKGFTGKPSATIIFAAFVGRDCCSRGASAEGTTAEKGCAMASGDTDIGGTERTFPTTRWTDIIAAQNTGSGAYRTAFNLFVQRYWKPVYCYVRRRGYDNEQAKDLTQDFFLSWLEDKKLGRAKPARGHFRSFLLTCLEHFLIGQRRRERAQRRHPAEGVVSIEELAQKSGPAYEPDVGTTPEAAFDMAWTRSVLEGALEELARYCERHGLQVHYRILRRRMLDPILEGARLPPLGELAEEFGLRAKEVANRLETAKRAFRRILRERIAEYATSETEIDSELRAIKEFLTM
jgi:RNA polymerase sigma-70 factor (ECF subfamily)